MPAREFCVARITFRSSVSTLARLSSANERDGDRKKDRESDSEFTMAIIIRLRSYIMG